ncbi:hypothetical protein ACFP9V_09420 [Deinococcus radiopugnans]|uniref:hypothetical protein n=1 Tax=Deinococcus radiopugnans TaxID=57497 RepID=UPI00360FD395
MNTRSLLEHAYRAALEAASPAKLLAPHLGARSPTSSWRSARRRCRWPVRRWKPFLAWRPW